MQKEDLKILSPKVDIIFKLLFGDERNIDILEDFLQSVLDLPEDEYESITLIDPHLKRENISDKLGIVDVRLKTKNGKIIHIEMQVLEQSDMPERAAYYTAKALTSQIASGDDYAKLKKTITIIIADFEIIADSPKYHNVFQLYDISNGAKFTDIIEIDTLELTKTPKTSDSTKKYQWMKFFLAKEKEEFQMAAENNPVINKAVVKLAELSEDEATRMIYEAKEKALRDERSRLYTAEARGEARGKARGEARGKAKMIRNLLNQGFPLQQIAEIAELPIAELEIIKNEVI